jgi:hypothetical protein
VLSTKALLRSAILACAVVAALSVPAAARAAPASTSFAIVGYEYAFTSTVGSFAGTATGNAGEIGAWDATVEHDPLGSSPTYINGGSFEMTTLGLGGSDFVTGSFVYHGGTITTINPGAGCTNQRYRVQGALEDVATETTSGGSGYFDVVLTHFRRSVWGHCVIYLARVNGGVTFSY